MANKHKKSPISLVMREIQIKITKKYHYTTNTKAEFFFLMMAPSVGEDKETTGMLIDCWGIRKWENHLEKWPYLRELTICLPYDPAILPHKGTQRYA